MPEAEKAFIGTTTLTPQENAPMVDLAELDLDRIVVRQRAEIDRLRAVLKRHHLYHLRRTQLQVAAYKESELCHDTAGLLNE